MPRVRRRAVVIWEWPTRTFVGGGQPLTFGTPEDAERHLMRRRGETDASDFQIIDILEPITWSAEANG